jgi:sulfonate transport system substrate-binding protein
VIKFLKLVFTAAVLVPFINVPEASSAEAKAAANEPKVVRIATVAYNLNGKTRYLGSTELVTDTGLDAELAKRGVKVEWVPAAHAMVGPIINEAFANKTIDFAAYGDLPPIILNGSKPRVQLVAPWGRSGNSYLVVPTNSSAKTIADLKGKRIALHRGRPWEIAFANLVQKNGFKLTDFKIVNVNPQVGAAALASGSVDAFYALNDAYNLVDKGVGKIIWSTKTAPPDWKLMGGLWARNDFVQQYPELTQAIVTSFIKANHWAAQEAHKETYLKDYASLVQPESVVRRDYEDDVVSWRDRWSPLYDQALVEHYKRAASYARESGMIRKDIDINQLLNSTFVDKALKELNLETFWTPSQIAAKQ